MKKIRIITDSASDISQVEAKELGISVLPLKTIFNDGEYLDGVTLSYNEFYDKLIETREIPKTSQINAYSYEEEFNKFKDCDILVITISSKISGCYNSACIASQDYTNVRVFDSYSLSIGEALIIKHAVKLVNEGKDIEFILKELEKLKEKLVVITVLDTMEYLKKGGRISYAKAFIGSILSIKPVLTVIEGKITPIGKARGSKNGQNMLRQMVKDEGIDFTKPYCAAYSGLDDSVVKKYLEDSKDLYPCVDIKDIPIRTVGSTIGTHVGPGAIAVAFFKK